MLHRDRGFLLSAAPLELLSCDLSWLADAALCLDFLVLMVWSLIALCLVVVYLALFNCLFYSLFCSLTVIICYHAS
jgi:hypothetical protein